MIQYLYSAFRSVRPLKFPLLYATGILILVAVLWHSVSHGNSMGIDLATGCILSITNAFLGYLVFRWSFSFSFQVSLFVAFTGIFVRFSLMLIAVAAILFLKIVAAGPFIAAFMSSYVALMAVEIGTLHKGHLKPRPASSRT